MAEVIIIGAGIAGFSTAYFLAADGVDVVLLEQHELNTLASGSNAGSLHAQIQPEPFVELGEAWARQFLFALPLYIESMSLWRDVGSLLGTDLEVAQDGGIVVAMSDKIMRILAAKSRMERSAGLETELLSASELRDKAPYVSEHMVGAAFCPIEGKANPLLAASAFAIAAQSHGATIQQQCRVTAIRNSKAGYEVETTKGSYHAARIVNAAGIEAGRVAAMLGGHVHMQSFPIQLSVTEPTEPLIGHLVYSGNEMLTLKQTKTGTVLIGGGWPAVLDNQKRAQVTSHSLDRNLRAALGVVPSLGSLRVVRTWAAQVNGNDSWLPVIGEMPGARGFYINYVPWMGLSGGLAASKIVASLVQGRAPPVNFDISPFRP
ncbi:MAG: FAD-binding oxidoreductase [Proteobacteria bacterium]|nr:FAD-binding oxidoreductase [Pseudomonadota bacterium]